MRKQIVEFFKFSVENVRINQIKTICNDTFSLSRDLLLEQESACRGAERIVKIDIM